MKEKRAKIQRRKTLQQAVFFEQDRKNYLIFGLALLVLTIGYIFLAQPPVNGFTSLTLAPLVLIIGYCILVPWAIFYRPKNNKEPFSQSQPSQSDRR